MCFFCCMKLGRVLCLCSILVNKSLYGVQTLELITKTHILYAHCTYTVRIITYLLLSLESSVLLRFQNWFIKLRSLFSRCWIHVPWDLVYMYLFYVYNMYFTASSDSEVYRIPYRKIIIYLQIILLYLILQMYLASVYVCIITLLHQFSLKILTDIHS